jgi:Rieske Fe-S protein
MARRLPVSGNASNSPVPRSVDAASALEERSPAEQLSIPDEPLVCAIHAAPPPMERRGFLVWLASAALAVGGLFMGATVIQALLPPSRSIDGKTKVGTIAIAKLADLQVGKPVLAEYGDDVLWLVKKSATQVAVLNQACPHVGCKLSFNAATKQFDCPCHASHFSIDGTRLSGPAPRGMIPAIFEIRDGQIVVSGISA